MNSLDQKTIALLSLVAGIAANHPAMGQCQLKRLRNQNVAEEILDAAIEIARHIRDEANSELDRLFDQAALAAKPAATETTRSGCGCTPTVSGQTCC